MQKSRSQSTPPTKPLLTYIRLYTINYLTSQYGSLSLTEDSINHLAYYIYQYMTQLLLEIKWVINAQGRTIPNFLILFAVGFLARGTLDGLLAYLDQRVQVGGNNNYMYQTKRFILAHRKDNNSSIPEYETPNNDIITSDYKNALVVHKPLSELIIKPIDLSLRHPEEDMIKRDKDKKEIIKREREVEIEMKKIINKQRLLNNYHVEIKPQQNIQTSNAPKTKFKLLQYL